MLFLVSSNAPLLYSHTDFTVAIPQITHLAYLIYHLEFLLRGNQFLHLCKLIVIL